MKKEKRLFVRIDEELKAKAQEKAKAEGLKLSGVIRELLKKWLEEGEGKRPSE